MRVELQSRLLSFDKEIDDVVLVASAATRTSIDVPVTVYSHDHKCSIAGLAEIGVNLTRLLDQSLSRGTDRGSRWNVVISYPEGYNQMEEVVLNSMCTSDTTGCNVLYGIGGFCLNELKPCNRRRYYRTNSWIEPGVHTSLPIRSCLCIVLMNTRAGWICQAC
jgi:hypothetical protein